MISDYMRRRQQIKLGHVTEKPKEAKGIAPVSEKKLQQIAEQKPIAELQEEWYQEKVKQQTGVCMECGGPTTSEEYKFKKACVAHVLPKRKNQFPSVATHPFNDLELCCVNGCHPNYDKDWETASQMKVWPIAVEKFKQIYPAIHPSERKHLPEVLKQEVEPK